MAPAAKLYSKDNELALGRAAETGVGTLLRLTSLHQGCTGRAAAFSAGDAGGGQE